MTNLTRIQKFLEPKKIAMAGVSRNHKKFGTAVFKDLKSKGFDLYPVNPNADKILGEQCFKSVLDLPADVKHLFIVTPKVETAGVVRNAVEKGIEMIWIQQSADTEEAIKIANENKIPVIYKKCILMFADPVKGIHGFHRFLAKTFGDFPKTEAV
jgi:hypothetical protein